MMEEVQLTPAEEAAAEAAAAAGGAATAAAATATAAATVATARGQQVFIISRHLRSCNNLIDDLKGFTVQKKADPELSLWGTLTGLLTPKLGGVGIVDESFTIDTVYVSCLLRTWLTAILKYLPSNNVRGKLTLVVSPYIKEHHVHTPFLNLDLGNLPSDNIQDQLNKLYRFFDVLQSLTHHAVRENIDRILSRLGWVYLRFPLFNNTEIKLFPKRENILLRYSNTENKIDKVYGNLISENQTQIPTLTDHEVHYVDETVAQIGLSHAGIDKERHHLFARVDPIPFNLIEQQEPIYTKYYGKDGIFLFVRWIKNYTSNLMIDDPNRRYIFAVAHSDIMQQFFVKVCELSTGGDCDKDDLPLFFENQGGLPFRFQDLKEDNMWDLIFGTDEQNISNITIRRGEPKPITRQRLRKDLEVTCKGFAKSEAARRGGRGRTRNKPRRKRTRKRTRKH
jgi:hypothetical protein